MLLKDEIKRSLAKALAALEIDGPDFTVEFTADNSHGDYASNVSLVAASAAGMNPRQLAERLLSAIELPKACAKVEVAGPGFLNFFLRDKYLIDNLQTILDQGNRYGRRPAVAEAKSEVVLEYTNTNVLKPFHIGHLLGNVIGESLARLMEAGGQKVRRVTYQGDSGLHIAKAVWGLKRSGGEKTGSLLEQVAYLGQCYADGAAAYENDPLAETEIKEINKRLFTGDDDELSALYHFGRQVSLRHFDNLYAKLGTKFDHYFFESEVTTEAVNLVKENAAKGIFTESAGALVFIGENYDPTLHTRVFLTAQGLPTYEAKDIAHAWRKDRQYPTSTASIIITAVEQKQYFQVVLRALAEIYPAIADKTVHLAHGMLRLPTGKMSSRTGEVITAETLIREVEELVSVRLAENDMASPESLADREEIALRTQQIAIGAIKYSILRQDVGRDIIFDFERSISLAGDSGPYLQYSYVRTQSVLARANWRLPADELKPAGEVGVLPRLLERYPEVIKRSIADRRPHHLCQYLFSLAAAFSSVYAAEKIIGSADEDYRLAETAAVGQVLKNGLDLLGIAVPDKM
ncbi:MAG: arginine--tRNA ligase [Candidatus Paceibacterota bacterium]